MKDSEGNEVRQDINIIELSPRDKEESETVQTEENLELIRLIQELTRSRVALQQANTPNNRANLEKVIEEAETSITDNSPIFRDKVWNPQNSSIRIIGSWCNGNTVHSK